ncbi:hypothetical protein IFM89_024297 [Coptis chinensis]|uniref:Uncharacterized protein n=1 Tax=Coptis chinensis TaxID=261450 RepID=A0A835IZK6_9MAGN|nr:hypothetical protein IFM89_024297 [Coptis chinensis]
MMGVANTPALAEYHGELQDVVDNTAELDFMTLADGVNMLLQNPNDIVHPPEDAANFEIEDTTIGEDLEVNTTDGEVYEEDERVRAVASTVIVRRYGHGLELNMRNFSFLKNQGWQNDENENDNSLGPGGDIRMYLEGLVTSKNVQKYIEQHPFGQQALTESDPSWPHYLQLINSCLHAPSDPGL